MTQLDEEKEYRRLKLRASIRQYVGNAAQGWRYLDQTRSNFRTMTDADFYGCIEDMVAEGTYTLSNGKLGGSKLEIVEQTKEKANG
jgi:hypothetical protein